MHQQTVVNGDSLRRVLREVHEHFGSERKAARALSITQPSFHKLLRGITKKRIGAGTLRRLLDVVRRLHGRERLEALLMSSVLTDEAAELSRLYGAWLRRSMQRLVPSGHSVFQALALHPDYRDLFEQFLQRLTGRPDVPASQSTRDRRIRLALLRAVEPLADAASTWGIERSWQEIHLARKLRSFLHHSLMRERRLLEVMGRYSERINELARSEGFRNLLLAAEAFADRGGRRAR